MKHVVLLIVSSCCAMWRELYTKKLAQKNANYVIIILAEILPEVP